ncbi:hypothetical protein BpHYR1_022278 [Brachionus plicatilis]|uniref:Uncharacterized protein n=1 Tax=Brachionus plicatilis TaxID=10195 RepID=A0A3M7QY43_BRAPC|nr:hypothetical protein BpHYR1_022278 [Brachionus plicatilis]
MQNSVDTKEPERIDLVKFFYENEINATVPSSGQAWCVGPVEMFTFRSAYDFGKLYIDNYIHLTKEVEPNFWSLASQFLIEPIAEALHDVLGHSSYCPFIVRNISNSTNQRNIDFGVENRLNEFSIYGEVSYSDEDIAELITDCVIKKKLSIENYFADKYKPNEKINWDSSVDKEDIKKCFFENNMVKYGKKILLHKRITTENCMQALNFELDLEKIQSDKSGLIAISIPIESLKFACKIE